MYCLDIWMKYLHNILNDTLCHIKTIYRKMAKDSLSSAILFSMLSSYYKISDFYDYYSKYT